MAKPTIIIHIECETVDDAIETARELRDTATGIGNVTKLEIHNVPSVIELDKY